MFTPLKTKRSHRLLHLPAFALERMKRHCEQQLEHRRTPGPLWRDPLDEFGRPIALVCDRGDGLPLYPDSFTSAFKRLARQAGMPPGTRLHDVRHAVATELGRRGVHAVIGSAARPRHPAFTVAVYQHAWQDGPREGASGAGGRARSPLLGRWQSVGKFGRPADRKRERLGEVADRCGGAGWTRTSDRRIMSPRTHGPLTCRDS